MAQATLKIRQARKPLLKLKVIGQGGRPTSWAEMGVWVGITPPPNPCTFNQWVANSQAGYWGWISD